MRRGVCGVGAGIWAEAAVVKVVFIVAAAGGGGGGGGLSGAARAGGGLEGFEAFFHALWGVEC